ncbi:MAG: efflux RND transporter periplasmic adaptor subunit [Desulfobacterales bacterium]|jgi:membrane fusion protein (multidrug efflux system)
MLRKTFHVRIRAHVSAIEGQRAYLRPQAAKIDAFDTRSAFWILLAGVFLLVAFPFPVIAGPPASDGALPPLVSVEPVTLQDVNPPEEYVGHVEAIQTVDLQARVEGFLKEVKFKEGHFVRAGDLLYVIEQDLYQATVRADRARVDQLHAVLTKARQYLERVRTVRSGGVSAADIDNAVAEEAQAKAQLEEARATLERSKLNLGYTTIRAPISGRIGRTAYTAGNLVGPASGPLARIVQTDPIRVVYSISENDMATIQMALKDAAQRHKNPLLVPHIRLPSGQAYPIAGQLDFVNNEVDAATGTIAVWAVFDNRDGLLLPGQYVTVLVTRSEPKLMPVISQSAVLEDHDGSYVLVVEDQNRVSMRRVKTGPMIGINWAIESGLDVGDSVQIIFDARMGDNGTHMVYNGKKELVEYTAV